MDNLSYEQLRKLIDTNSINYYNIYNSDQDIPTYFSAEYYINNPHDNVDINQILNIAFTDIEVYQEDRSIKFDFDGNQYPINAITVYLSNTKTFYSLYWLLPTNQNLFDKNYNFLDELKRQKYCNDDCNFQYIIYTDEKAMLTDYWNLIKGSNISILSGFNFDIFDLPYIYRRMLYIFGNKSQVHNMISAFGHVEMDYNKMVKIPEYVVLDILYCYKPRSDGGLNLGKKQASYKLDYIAEDELGINKVSYSGDIHEFYEKDPTQFLLYNIVDVALCVKLNDKLQHIELQNIIRRRMGVNLSRSLIGSSSLFDCFVLTTLLGKDQFVRHGMAMENNKSYTADSLKHIPIPITGKKATISPIEITQSAYSSFVCKFDGAYVRKPYPGIYNTGTVIDLDATSLYPSEIQQHNIGFDTYVARVIPPLTYKFIQLLTDHLGIKQLPNAISSNVYNLIDDFVEREEPANKSEARKQWYYITMSLIYKLAESKVKMVDLMQPKTDIQYILLSHYLIPLLDIFNTIHPEFDAYNKIVYDYLFHPNSINEYNCIYVIRNIQNSNKYIEKLTPSQFLEYIGKEYILTITGCIFEKHSTKLGLYYQMLHDLGAMRRKYVNEANKFVDNKKSLEYQFYNSREKSVKVVMNSLYGLLGLSSFRYSNHHLAQTVTTSGRLGLKISQYISEQFIKNKFKET